MRNWFGTVTAVGFLAAAAVQVGTLPAAAETSTPHLLTFGDAANGDRPVILRGSAGGPKSAPAVTPSYQRHQVAAGRRLWFFDPATQDIRSCINERTSTVGVRIIRCYSGSLSGYRRTFGPAFQP
ncbi:MAG: hypothetical protein ACREJ5_21070 [Geminicoccaceae bacterium]